MIPKNENELIADFEIETNTSKTYYLDIDKNRIIGMCDEEIAIRQAVYMILNTERFEHIIYSWNYGVEFKNLIGENKTYIIPELERVIKEALIQDDRINDVNNFEFKTDKKNIIVTFNVITDIGEFAMNKVVNYIE